MGIYGNECNVLFKVRRVIQISTFGKSLLKSSSVDKLGQEMQHQLRNFADSEQRQWDFSHLFPRTISKALRAVAHFCKGVMKNLSQNHNTLSCFASLSCWPRFFWTQQESTGPAFGNTQGLVHWGHLFAPGLGSWSPEWQQSPLKLGERPRWPLS